MPSEYSVLCEKHFTSNDYYAHDVNKAKKILKPDAVPSVFEFPPHLSTTTKPRKTPAKRKASIPVKTEIPEKKSKFQTNLSEHSYCMSPSKTIPKMKKSLEKKRKKIKVLTKKNIRKEKTIKGLLKKLESMKHLDADQTQRLLSNFGHLTRDLFTNELKNSKKGKNSRYSDSIKQFAVSLHFYSPRAYEYVRKSLHLPCSATIRAWAAAIQCEPGFLTDVIEHLQNTLKDDEKDCILLVDEMAIKKEVIWDVKNKKFAGHTDYGPILAEEPDSIATNALVVMAVGLKRPWFHPVAYFLVDRITSKMQAQIINEAISLLTEASLEVHGVTFDGCAKNIATARCLGCKIDKFDGSFKHPTRPNKTLYVILDICHMLKLARNSLGDMKVFFDEDGNTICWHYITDLYNVQKNDVLHLGNKLKSVHIKWHNQKMKVAVAAQTMSNSVAAGIMYLKNLKLEQFEKSQETAEFILIINNLFDILNSKSKFGKNYKSPITLNNIEEIQDYVNQTIHYLTTLVDKDGIKLVAGPRKTFIVGFALSSKSILSLAKRLLERDYNRFDYLLTYRFSQDQLEMFFSKIRSRLGWNNNPNALQFKWALRALLQKNEVTSSKTANPVVDEEKLNEDADNADNKLSLLLKSSNIWRDDVLEYIGGFIVKKISSCIKCAECAGALSLEMNDGTNCPDHAYFSTSPKSSLISFKTYGKLTTPSTSVVKIVKIADKYLRAMVEKWSHLPDKATLILQRDVLQDIKSSAFQSIHKHSQETHILDENCNDDHITILIKKITELYSKIFLRQFSKVYSERIVRENVPSKRQKLTKLILFGND